MKALLLYIVFVAAGDTVSAFIGVFIEHEFNSIISLIVFLALFFGNFAGAWILTILVIDGSLKNAQSGDDQLEAERIGRLRMGGH